MTVHNPNTFNNEVEAMDMLNSVVVLGPGDDPVIPFAEEDMFTADDVAGVSMSALMTSISYDLTWRDGDGDITSMVEPELHDGTDLSNQNIEAGSMIQYLRNTLALLGNYEAIAGGTSASSLTWFTPSDGDTTASYLPSPYKIPGFLDGH